MSVYVDDLRATVQFPGHMPWKMSHMIADTRDELDEMAEILNLKEKWKQKAGEQLEHYDVTENYRRRAIKAGAIPISVHELSKRLLERDLQSYLEGRALGVFDSHYADGEEDDEP